MQGKVSNVSTQELWARLFRSASIDQYWEEGAGEIQMPAFSDYITKLAEAKNERPERVIKRSGLERSSGHKLFSGSRNPSRDSALQLAFGLELSADETKQLLKVAQATPLHPKVKRDAVVAFCLHNSLSVIEAQQVLHDNDLPLLGGKKAKES